MRRVKERRWEDEKKEERKEGEKEDKDLSYSSTFGREKVQKFSQL